MWYNFRPFFVLFLRFCCVRLYFKEYNIAVPISLLDLIHVLLIVRSFFRLVSNTTTLHSLIIIFQIQIKHSLTAIWRYFRKSLFESNWRILQRRGFQVVARRFDFPVHGKSYSKDRIRKCQVQKVFVSIVLHQSDFRMWTENGGGSFTIFAFRMQRHGWKGGQVRSC